MDSLPKDLGLSSLGLETAVDLKEFFSYVGAAFAAYYVMFFLGYIIPLNPGDGKPTKDSITTRRSIAFANRVAAISHAIGELSISTYFIYNYATYDSSRMFLPIKWDIALPVEAHNMVALIVGYCLADGAYIVVCEYDFLMFAHHVAVIMAIMPFAWAPYGWLIAAFSTWTAEITNPIQNVWQFCRDYGPKPLYQAMSPLFTYSFATLRGVVMPLLLLDYFIFLYAEQRMDMGLGLWLPVLRFSVLIFTGGWFGSLMWLKGVIVGYWRYKAKLKAQKASKSK